MPMILVYLIGRFNFHAESYGEIETEVVDIYKRQTDGSWKIYIDCFNYNPKWTNDLISADSMKNQDPVL